MSRGPATPARRGRFIVFEGIDGSGKSTALEHTAAQLRARWPDLVTTREETSTPLGAAVRDAVARHADPATVAFLFLADRAEHARELEAHLAAGRHVLCDRYELSTYAYQSVTLRGRVPDPVAWLRTLHAAVRLRPDHTLLFVADPARCVERTTRRGATTPYEKAGFLAEVQRAYLAVSDGDARVQRLDAERPMGDVAADALGYVQGWLSGAS